MLLKSNLRLLISQLDNLSETPYFSSDLDQHTREIRQALDVLLSKISANSPTISLDVAYFVAYQIWHLTQFLTGSTTKQIPYEVVSAIEQAASDWNTDKLLITTAIVQEANFYFASRNKEFFRQIESELGIKITHQPVQILLPYIYRHKPLFCIPLFHELGHYIDTSNDIVNTSLMTHSVTTGPDMPELPTTAEISNMDVNKQHYLTNIVRSHRAEYFADLISAVYVGEAAAGFIKQFAPDAGFSITHPSSTARFKVMEDFLAGNKNPIIDMFQDCLAIRGLPELKIRYSLPDINETFRNVRPTILNSNEEVFGIFVAGWKFLNEMTDAPVGLWQHIPIEEFESVANDLVEKSIRNRMIQKGWDEVTH